MPINFINDIVTELDSTFTPEPTFFNTTSILDIVANVSSDAEAFVLEGLDEISDAVGDLTIASGNINGSLATATQDLFSFNLDTSNILASLRPILMSTSATLSLAEGIVDASFQFEDTVGELEDFDLATFSADGVERLISWVDTTLPIENGAILIDFDTFLGPINGSIDFAGGDLDVVLNTVVGDLDFSFDFGPDAQIILDDLGVLPGEIVINFDSGNIETAALGEIPLSSLSAELSLQDGIAELFVDTPIGSFLLPGFDLGAVANDLVFDALTGLTVDASLAEGQLDLLATREAEQFQTSIDLPDLAEQLIALVDQVDGGLTLGAGVLDGELAIGQDTITINETVAGLEELLTATPISDILGLPTTA